MSVKDFIVNTICQRWDTLRPGISKAFRWLIVILSYLVIFALLDKFSKEFQIYPGVVAWYPPDGISMAFLFTFGAGFSPFVALASIISSMVIYNFSTPPILVIGWAVILAIIFGILATFLRRNNSNDKRIVHLRDLILWIIAIFFVTSFLSIISVSNLVDYGVIERSQLINAGFQWWVGEMIGLLVFTPFLLMHILPGVRRFINGEKLSFPKSILRKPTPQDIWQAVSMLVVLYLIFGVHALQEFHPFFLIAMPLIWVALSKGFAQTTIAIVLSNFGIMIAILVFKFDRSLLGEFQFLMFGIFFSVLLLGAIVTKQKTSEEELKQKEIHFKALIENAPDGILLMGVNRMAIYESPSTKRIMGYDPSQRYELNLALLTHPDDAPALTKLVDEVIQTKGRIATTQYRIKHRNGSWRWLESTFTNQLDNPNINAVIVNFHDITDQRLAEESERQSENRLQALIEHSQEEINLIDENGLLKYESPNILRPLGYPHGSLIGQSIFDVFHPDDREAAMKVLAQARKKGASLQQSRFRLKHLDGSWRWMEGTITNLLDEPAVQSIVINYRDVTDRVNSENEIAVLAKFPSESPNPMLRMSRDGILLYANEASKVILGMWNCSVGEKVPDYMTNITAIAFARKENLPVELTCEEEVYSMVVTPVFETGYVNLYGRDITKRKKAEESLKISNEVLSMLFDLSHSLAEADNLDSILDIVNRNAVESVHCSYSRIALIEDGNFVIRAAYPIRPLAEDLSIGLRIPISSMTHSQHVLESNEPVVLVRNDAEICKEEKNSLFECSAQSVCLIPLRISDSSLDSEKQVGLLMLGEIRSTERQPFTAENIRLARTIGDSAAIAIRRKLLLEQTEHRMQQLIALSEIDLAIISNTDMRFRLGVVCLQIIEQLKVDAVDIWTYDPTSQALELAANHGFRSEQFTKTRVEPLAVSEGYMGQAVTQRHTIHCRNLVVENKNPRFAKALAEEPFASYYAVPLIVNDQVKGVLELFCRDEFEGNAEWLTFLHALANQTAIAIDNSSLFMDLQQSNVELTQAYDETIQGWSRALDLRDNETEGHTLRVTELTMKLSHYFGIPEEELVHIRRGALLHDIGKMGVPDRILLKPGPLTDEEWVVMRKHTTFASDLLSPIPYLKPALDIPLYHHEKWDGSGYPCGLAGDQIPFSARLFAVIDVWDALTSDRPYRKAWTEEKAFDHIRSLSGTHFDPQIVKICLEPGVLMGYPKNNTNTEQLQWTDKYSVGVSELDQQHQKLFKMLNRLISVNRSSNLHTETITNVLKEMNQYAEVHFATEERLMDTFDYPKFEEHRISHQGFQEKTQELCTATENGMVPTTEELLEYLSYWWRHHILEEDMAYKGFFNEKGIR